MTPRAERRREERVASKVNAAIAKGRATPLKATITGGGPVGLIFGLILEHLLGSEAEISMYDQRWIREGSRIVWKNEQQGNVRRQQVVTIQSRQFRRLPSEIQCRVFREGSYSEMWPVGPDSIDGFGPRNVRIADIEDTLLEMANENPNIRLIPKRFDAGEQRDDIRQQHIVAICEGASSRTREHFIDKFGKPDTSMYSLDGEHLSDTVLGLRVKSDLSDGMTVLLTVGQNRFLLNSLRGVGFLNMRLTDEEAKEVVGIDLAKREFTQCIQSSPCVMEGRAGEFRCPTHGTLFLPALLKRSPLWRRVLEGLKLFGVEEENLSAVTAFKLDLVQRPRFTAQLFPAVQGATGTIGFILGDAGIALHFWPGRGLNSGIASVISLARCIDEIWNGRPFREADFVRHEGNMAMLQYRHKTRAWNSMVATDETTNGGVYAFKVRIAEAIAEGESGTFDKNHDIEELVTRLAAIRNRLESRICGLPDDDTLRRHFAGLEGPTLRTLVASGAWNTAAVGGEEVDVGLLFPTEDSTDGS